MGSESEVVTTSVDEPSGTVVLRVRGALDFSIAPSVCEAVEAAADPTAAPRRIVVDLSQVDSSDPRCLVALMNAAREAGARVGPVVSVVGDDGAVANQLARVGASDVVPVYRSYEETMERRNGRRERVNS
jgi:anti-anti-sigma factor